jgi:hypothetical protein
MSLKVNLENKNNKNEQKINNENEKTNTISNSASYNTSNLQNKFMVNPEHTYDFFGNYYSPPFINPEILDEKTLFSKQNILKSFMSQKLTRYLQKSLVNASKEIINYIISELSGTFRVIFKNKNGNYFCSNLIKVCDRENRIKILKELSETLCDDCIDPYGTYPIQSLIEFASGEDEFKLILSSFNDFNKILMISLNQHGTYVIQKIIRHIPEQQRIEFNTIFAQFVTILSRDTYGAYALEKFICFTKDDQIQKQILNSIITNFVNISTNKNGNYLIQCLLEKWWKNKKGEALKKMIVSKYQILSKNIYSSHICDLYVKLLNNEQSKKDV